ncbi:hypothetical protein SDC9_158681 [bioreactor metagenome]|uniref:Uncharacterized protein n=1 Tax=bioreactor metagenome TaxID=1076179 RepID=A0A645FBT6_9ZZZZ
MTICRRGDCRAARAILQGESTKGFRANRDEARIADKIHSRQGIARGNGVIRDSCRGHIGQRRRGHIGLRINGRHGGSSSHMLQIQALQTCPRFHIRDQVISGSVRRVIDNKVLNIFHRDRCRQGQSCCRGITQGQGICSRTTIKSVQGCQGKLSSLERIVSTRTNKIVNAGSERIGLTRIRSLLTRIHSICSRRRNFTSTGTFILHIVLISTHACILNSGGNSRSCPDH